MEALKKELQSAQTMQDFLDICSKHYDFKNAKLGVISKAALIANIHTVIKLSGAKAKNG